MNKEHELDIAIWHEIGDKLTTYLVICSCQRKLKSIVSVLVRIYDKILAASSADKSVVIEWTPEEYLIIALLDTVPGNLLSHGINIEYPILCKEHAFWEWIMEIKDNPNLVDN